MDDSLASGHDVEDDLLSIDSPTLEGMLFSGIRSSAATQCFAGLFNHEIKRVGLTVGNALARPVAGQVRSQGGRSKHYQCKQDLAHIAPCGVKTQMIRKCSPILANHL